MGEETKIDVNIGKEISVSGETNVIGSKLSAVPKYIFWALAFILPIWILPLTISPLRTDKAYLLFVFVAAGSIFWIISRIQEGRISIPKSSILLSIVFIIAAWLAAAIFSNDLLLSLIGGGFELGTFSTIFFLGIIAVLFSILFQTEKDAIYIYYLIFGSSILIFIFQFFRTILNISIIPFNILQARTANFVGTWNDLGVFFGFVALESLILFELLNGRKKRIFFLSVLLLSSLGLVIINFLSVWLILGIFAVVFMTYLFSVLKDIRVFSRSPLFIIIISFLFIVSHTLIGDFLSSSGINALEVRPSWSSTFEIINRQNYLGNLYS